MQELRQTKRNMREWGGAGPLHRPIIPASSEIKTGLAKVQMCFGYREGSESAWPTYLGCVSLYKLQKSRNIALSDRVLA